MTGEDWAGVAHAITQRMSELGLTQHDLIDRSQVSKATVGELQRNTIHRRRSTRTLEALSVALDWHPEHLHAILTGRPTPARPGGDLAGHLTAVEHQLRQLNEQLATLNTTIEHFNHLLTARTNPPTR